MSNTSNLLLPLLASSQAQKHITVNEALLRLDLILQLNIVEQRNSPPTSPQEGQVWIVTATASNEWAGQEYLLAAWQDGIWHFIQPKEGWIAYDNNLMCFMRFDGTIWTNILGDLTLNTLKLTSSPSNIANAGTQTLPSNPVGFMPITLAGQDYKIPLYNI